MLVGDDIWCYMYTVLFLLHLDDISPDEMLCMLRQMVSHILCLDVS